MEITTEDDLVYLPLTASRDKPALPRKFLPALQRLLQRMPAEPYLAGEGKFTIIVKQHSDSRTTCAHCGKTPDTVMEIGWINLSQTQGETEQVFYCTDCASDLEATIDTYITEHAGDVLSESL